MGECWLWPHRDTGSAYITKHGRSVSVTRLIFEAVILKGKMLYPDRQRLRKMCGVAHCVSPYHLYETEKVEQAAHATK